jgi:hypothetical protein
MDLVGARSVTVHDNRPLRGGREVKFWGSIYVLVLGQLRDPASASGASASGLLAKWGRGARLGRRRGEMGKGTGKTQAT